MTEIEKKFHNEMIEIYNKAKKELNYNSTRFLNMISELGGVETAHKLISSEGGIEGFEEIWINKRRDLTVENSVLKPEYAELFTDDERKICEERLKKFDL